MKKKIRIFLFFLLLNNSYLFSNGYTDVLNKGIVLLKQGMYDEALKMFEDAQKISSDNSTAYYYMGEALYLSGETEKAVDNYNKAIELQPAVPEYHFSLALVYIAVNKTEEAVGQLTKVTEIAPNTVLGKRAKKLKQEIVSSREEKEILKKWVKLEEEAEAKLKEAAAKPQTEEGLIDEFGEFIEGGAKRESAEKLIRRVKFGTMSTRKTAAASLYSYRQDELQQIDKDMIDIASREKDVEIRKNLILSLGKAGTPEAVELLLKMLQDGSETFDMRIAALEGLSALKSEELTAASRETLDRLVINRETERKNAKKRIEEIEKRIGVIQQKRDEISLKSMEQSEKFSELQMKLEEISFPELYGIDPGSQKRVSPQDVAKLREEVKKMADAMEKRNEEVAQIDQEVIKLQNEKARLENLLTKRIEMSDASFRTRQSPASPSSGSMPPMEGMTPEEYYEMYGEYPGGGGRQQVYVETDEEKNEVVFAVSLIKTLGRLRDRESLDIIKRGWEEYWVEQQKIYYLLTLARLGDFSGIETLIARLRADYPAGEVQQEVLLRAGIIDVIGNYLSQNDNEMLLGLIEYLKDEGGYTEIRSAAAEVMAKIVHRAK